MADRKWSDGLLEGGLGDDELADLLGWSARIERMIEVEAALTHALHDAGLISETARDDTLQLCDTARVDEERLAKLARTSATPVIALLAELTRDADPTGSAYLHLGATSQDIIDTAVTLQLRDALERLQNHLLRVAGVTAALADRHRSDILPARTLGQHAVVSTFGLTAARWLAALDRRIEQLRLLRPRVLVLQLGGAAGTLSVYGEDADAVLAHMAARLQLEEPATPWHAERDRTVEVAGTLFALVAVLQKIAGDIVLLAQTDVGELRQLGDTGPSSSAMPHKSNPTHAAAVRTACHLANGELQTLINVGGANELERGAGAWQAEGIALSSALVRIGGAVNRLHDALTSLDFVTERAAANIAAQRGLLAAESLSTALAAKLGRHQAQQLVAQLAARVRSERQTLLDVATSDPNVTAALEQAEIEAALHPSAGLRAVDRLIDRALAAHQHLTHRETS